MLKNNRMCYKTIKNLLVVLLVFCSVASYGQRDTILRDYSVYNYNNQYIESLYPSYQVQEAYHNEWHVYEVDDFNIKSTYPVKVIEFHDNSFYIYCVDENGIREVNPYRVIRKQ